MALDCGESCDVKLDPHITRIANMEWLLPICVRQLGTEIAIRDHPEGDSVVMTITATATRNHKTCPPAARRRPIAIPERQPVVVTGGKLAAVV
jgi:hypothetical protein